jgi:hypothetical protein
MQATIALVKTASARKTEMYLLTFFLFLLTFNEAPIKVDLTFRTSNEQMAIYNSIVHSSFSAFQRAMGQVKSYMKDVSMDNVTIAGYYFGGSGVVQYGFLWSDRYQG